MEDFEGGEGLITALMESFGSFNPILSHYFLSSLFFFPFFFDRIWLGMAWHGMVWGCGNESNVEH